MGARHTSHPGPPDVAPELEPCDPSKIVTRAQWGAAAPLTEEYIPLKLPVKKVRGVYTHTDMCYNVNQCSRICREIQAMQMDVGCPDIIHNFLIGADGNIYEGRGWHNESCIMQGDWELIGRTLDIGFIGPFVERMVPDNIIQMAKRLLLYGIKEGYIQEHYDSDTLSPFTNI